ncbi:MAG: HEAT repeat domain-containing protein [Phycisphaeraceae bacterium]|nr:HEAT repeat domain-containing protein [Phycisphaeraceae bacterium]
MVRGRKIFSLLRSIADPSVDMAMAGALPTADNGTRLILTQQLLNRNHSTCLNALLRNYHLLPEPAQELVIANTPQLGRILRNLAQNGNPQDQTNVLQVTYASKDPKLCYLFADILRYGALDVNEDAASALLSLVHQIFVISDDSKNDEQTTRATSQQIDLLQNTIEKALTLYGVHQQPAVIEAILEILPRPFKQAAKVLNDVKHPATQTFMQLCESPSNPSVCTSMLSLLGIPVLTESIFKGIGFMAEARTLHLMLSQGHLLLLPSRRKALRKLQVDESYFPQIATTLGITPRQLRHLPQWYATISRSPEQFIEQLGSLRKANDPATRLAALRRLIQISPPQQQSINLVAAYCADSDQTIARIALRHLIRIGYEDMYHLMLRLINSPHDSVRKLASNHLGPVGFEKYWDSWHRFDLNQRIAAGKALIKIDPCFHVQLGQKLDGNNAQDMQKAMEMIRTLNQGTFFEYALEHLTHHEKPKIASAAVKTLGSAGTQRAAKILETSLEHDDPRMRANAVEALDHIEHRNHMNKLLKMSKEDDNRPRANAIGALLSMNFGDALTTLANMLNDERPSHRVSALWLVDHLDLRDMVRHVAELSISDKDTKVRQRASKLVEHFITSFYNEDVQVDHQPVALPASKEVTP